jgi:hypothetical protein
MESIINWLSKAPLPRSKTIPNQEPIDEVNGEMNQPMEVPETPGLDASQTNLNVRNTDELEALSSGNKQQSSEQIQPKITIKLSEEMLQDTPAELVLA